MALENREGRRVRRRTDAGAVLHQLEEFCATLQPGDVIPTHTELMRRLDASERSVRWALDEMRRQGKIVRRVGAGTFVAERRAWHPLAGGSGQGHVQGEGQAIVPAQLAGSGTVVAIGPHDYSFFDRCMHLLLRQAEDAGLTLVCRLLEPGINPLAVPLEVGQSAGVILFSYQFAPLAKQLQEAGHRVVLVGTPPADVTPEVPCVYADHEQSGYLAARHLLDLGHRRIAFAGEESLTRTLRWRGNQRAIREAQRRSPVRTTFFPIAEIKVWQRDPQLAAACFSQPEAPTGVVAWNDHEALTLLGILQRANVKIPEHVSLVGHDDLPEGQLVHPSLTTINPAIEQQLQVALRLLTQPVPPPASHSVVVLPTLISRESSASAPKI